MGLFGERKEIKRKKVAKTLKKEGSEKAFTPKGIGVREPLMSRGGGRRQRMRLM